MVNGFTNQLIKTVSPSPFQFFDTLIDKRRKVNLDHHRINHQPDQNRYRNIYRSNIPVADYFYLFASYIAYKNTCHYTEQNPKRQIFFKFSHMYTD
ncbi:hypothetical protein DES35_104162 [Schleiferia thermophila]|uniref:Uncharacterized protein n=1 Tax=Schleiferia thermophila TaxID=884107 RepID=A0A368ZZE7_9FLAO|nr:hypothetical protein DES35_104162 [Schleiferia thermophila]